MTAPPTDPALFTLDEVLAFLHGETQLDGVSFGERHPTERGAFWWRKHLRAAVLAERERRDDAYHELLRAASKYFRNYCLDEADENGEEYTGCGREQHLDAVALGKAIAAFKGPT